MQRLLLFFGWTLGVCLGSGAAFSRAADVDFVRDVRPIFQQHCYACHGETKQKSGLRLDVKSEAFRGGEGYGPSIIAGKVDESPLIELVTSDDEYSRMPPEGPPLTEAQITTLTRWVEQGAVWPDGVDLVKLEDPRDHWSFKPVGRPVVPSVQTEGWARNDIDRFVLARLEHEGLSPAAEAEPITWLRRVTLDLTGLPPTPADVDMFMAELREGEAAYTAAVDRLLASPRYGERWAQHWLDVVRYADTHGFEVNTERPNAWPYRDYVISALNRDLPYDQFVKEQIVGDALGADAATGFLITASVLLPGQIGQDEPSKRLARQDALDEIVNNLGQTFLGLSIGCARCHDHKFDPISSRDYYAMQAFVAGVEYGDRTMRTPEAEALRSQVTRWQQRVGEIDQQLAQFVPLAHPESTTLRQTNAKRNVETFAPRAARFVRFTIHDCDPHPTLGLIEPCIDEFEIYTDEPQPRNVALAAHGTQVTASGSRTSDAHKLEHIHDGQYGNSRSWMSDTSGTGWVMFELPETVRITEIVWGRDRLEQFADRLPNAYTIEAGLSSDDLTRLVHVPPRRPMVRAAMNTDRFTPVQAKRMRFTILATNKLEPCLDELEVVNTAGDNVALASHGTTIRTSGDNVVANRHEPRFVNDGEYGNSRSWMSNEDGGGWVELEFPEEEEITRVVWGRDRKGEYTDRLATSYRIETSQDGNDWVLVADATDRKPWSSSAAEDSAIHLAGLDAKDAAAAQELLIERRALEAQIKSAEVGQLVFAGVFREPDQIHLLARGDPEQPKDMVLPAMPQVLGGATLSEETPEQLRRRALAEWIASPYNPLTARVMVNRIWQGHFGTGLVMTANDFGRNGMAPSHPELLDWLAGELVRSGWSVKQLHRQIVLSATYRQSSDAQSTELQAAGVARDADVRLLWRYPSRRLEAEVIRDTTLLVSGKLRLSMGGRGFDLFDQRGGLSGFKPVESFAGDGLKRMIYAHKVRRERDAVFGAFDCPDAGQSMARRVESTTPIQALNLFNSPFTIEQAEALAARIRTEVGESAEQQVMRAYEVALNRQPGSVELEAAEPVVREHGLETLCRVLFNSNEFLFLP